MQLSDIIGMVNRRKILIIIVSFICIVASLFVVFSLPAIYSSTSVVSIVEQQVPEDLVESTVTSYAEERIQVIKQRVLVIENIVSIIDKFNLYSDDIKRLNITELSDLFKSSIHVSMVNANISGKRGRNMQTAIAFTVSFEYKDPSLAQKVANEVTTLILNENITTRTSRAKETYDFINEEADKLKAKIQDIEVKIADYKEQFGDSMPELLIYNMSTIKSLEDRLAQLIDGKNSLIEEKKALEKILGNSPTNGDGTSLNPTNSSAIQLNQLKIRLAELQQQEEGLLNKYAPQHPDVKKVQREISEISYKIESFEPSDSTTTLPPSNTLASGNKNSLNYLKLESELALINQKISNIEIENKNTTKRLEEFRKRVAATPQVERGYNDLLRGLDSTKRKYAELSAKQIEAELALTLEEGNMAESFKLLEAARKPEKPVKPNRPKLIAMAILGSLGLAFALAFFLEQQSSQLRGAGRISAALGDELLMSIPIIETQEDIRRKKRNLIYFIIFIIVLMVSLITIVHLFIMPLDIAFYKLLDKAGIL